MSKKLSLAEQLRAKGHIDERKFVEHSTQIKIDRQLEEANKKKKEGGKDDRPNPLKDLDSAATMEAFKEVAKVILEREPDLIEKLILKAHRFKDEAQEENRKFIWFFYALRDSLRAMPRDQHDLVLRRAFRRHNPDPVTNTTTKGK